MVISYWVLFAFSLERSRSGAASHEMGAASQRKRGARACVMNSENFASSFTQRVK
jgi:hypothetical protein